MNAKCAARAAWAAARSVEIGQVPSDLRAYWGEQAPRVARNNLAWCSYAAFEYPRPMFQAAANAALIVPEMAEEIWHRSAGAAIVGPACDCATPAGHRDALAGLLPTEVSA